LIPAERSNLHFKLEIVVITGSLPDSDCFMTLKCGVLSAMSQNLSHRHGEAQVTLQKIRTGALKVANQETKALYDAHLLRMDAPIQ